MALKSLIYTPAGRDAKGHKTPPGIYLNSLKRFALSSILVPPQELLVAQIPQASSATNPGRSLPIPIQGPNDGTTEVYSLTGKQAVVNQGVGQITTDGITTTVTGSGTKFLTQLQAGSVISTTAGNGTVATISSDTVLTTSGAMAANASVNFFFSIPAATNGAGFNISVIAEDVAWRRMLMNRDVPAPHVFGSNTKPLFMKESILLETNQALSMQFLNYSTSGADSFAPIMEGRKWQYEAMKSKSVHDYIDGLRARKMYIQPYWLTLDNRVSSINGSASKTELLTCTGDITLVLFNVYAQAFTQLGAADASDNVLVSLQDAKTDRAIQTQPVPLSIFGGTSQNPMRLSSPWIVEPQTFIKAKFQNNNGSSVNIYMTFHGVAIYTGSSWRGSTLTNAALGREYAKMYEAMSTPQIRAADIQG